ncbi:MAG: T9SS type A sorting domain-containing protein, partial [Anaerolineae bacterium]|nr:T9SS type A sorting domain-containing protein [Anaerolineae bacterium]
TISESRAQDFWQQTNGPYGGYIRAFAINPVTQDIFVGTNVGGVYRSTNNGDNWTEVNTGLTYTRVFAFAMNSNGDIFAGTGFGGVFRSTNNGENWTEVNAGLTRTYVEALAINSSEHIFAGTDGGVFRSTDNGDSWREVNTGLTSTHVQALAINSSGHIFAGTLNGVFLSTDNGDSWTAVNYGLTNNAVQALAINLNGYVFAGNIGGRVSRSSNNGGNWTEVYSSLMNTAVFALAINTSGHIFAGTNGDGVFRSIDDGDNWTAVNLGLTNTLVLALAINASGHIFAGTNGGGVFLSTDNGDSWTEVNIGLTNTFVRSLVINSGGHFFAGTDGGGVFRSTNNGDSWTAVNLGLTNTIVFALTVNASGHIFAGTDGGGVFRSTNNGDSWRTVNFGLTETRVFALAINSTGHIFAGTYGGVSRSTNNGDGWTAVDFGLTDSYIYALAINSIGHIFAGTNRGRIFRSTDNGNTWTAVSFGLTDTYQIYTLAINTSGHIFAGAFGGGVFRSTNNGDSWTAVNLGLTNTLVLALAVNASGNIFAGTWGGVFRSTDNGDSWAAVNSGLTPPIFSLAIDLSGNLFAGTIGWGVFRSLKSTDLTPPQILHAPVTSIQFGQNLPISATLIDAYGIETAKLYFRLGGESTFDSTAMAKASGDTYIGVIPASFITDRGIEYYFSAQDAAGNKTIYPATNPQANPQVIQVINSNLIWPSPTPAFAYQMISIPFHLDSSSVAVVLEDDLGPYDDTQWRLLRYVSGTNVEYGGFGFVNLDPGTGFWLITRTARLLDAGKGKSVTTAQNYLITLQPGWSQIGNPFAFTVNWSDVIKGANVENILVGYQGALNEATGYDYTRTHLVPFEGYFVNNRGSSSTTIEIPPKAASGSSLAKSAAGLLELENFEGNEWGIQITAACDRYLDKDNYLGCFNDADDAWDSNDFSEAPFFDKHVSLYFPHREWENYPGLYTGDFRVVKAEGDYWDFRVQTNINQSEVTLTLADMQNVPADWDVILLDKASSISVNFRENRKYTFISDASEKTEREFRIVVGEKEFVEGNDLNLSGVPEDFKLSQNYPNPFNPDTRINYELPATSHVKISVYNLNGQLVRTLLNAEQSAGRYFASWDGINGQGDRVASGIYLVRMEAGTFMAVRKMVFAK